ncbi:MAG TPA: EpsG family protein [Sphingomicrobium sp.]|nr:EpsG family protein [Sphingomicrobium sp.]
MLIYWLLFLYFAIGVFASPAGVAARPRSPAFLTFGAVIIALVVGFRYKVGADWYAYDIIFNSSPRYSFWKMLEFGDPAYQALNWILFHQGFGFWAVNLICGAIFSWGLLRFVRVQPSPWLAMTIAIPYIVIVVGMGYTRQGVALGILLAGIAAQARGASTLNFAVYCAAAASFHASAAIVFPLVALSAERNRAINVLITISVGYLLYGAFIQDDARIANYIESGLSSQGAFIRVSLNVVAALVFLVAGRRMGFTEREYRLWRNFSLAALGFVVLLAVFPSTTAVDRLSLYIMPIQVGVLARAAGLGRSQISGLLAIVGYSAAIQFVWLNFAQHSRLWIPYQFYPL